MTRDDVRQRLTAARDGKSIRAYAASIGLPEVAVRRVITNGDEPGERLLAALGLRRVERYEVDG